ncbi:hypothetical protein LAZ67_3004807 [Cordylochernes scorpioides]|uniref:Uncharacterized protein n=1 Tax=Cordylochernes scorpioides TaxID=51811 RepID=A0ABY6K9V9_9ARAC|nr:hypothetical protein LAZ67_3004807 [Cordylochernes scorpioides]
MTFAAAWIVSSVTMALATLDTTTSQTEAPSMRGHLPSIRPIKPDDGNSQHFNSSPGLLDQWRLPLVADYAPLFGPNIALGYTLPVCLFV